jgi:hypothetical protein
METQDVAQTEVPATDTPPAPVPEKKPDPNAWRLKDPHYQKMAEIDQIPTSKVAYNSRTPFVHKVYIGRNDLCTCGSSKKYKKCHGK